MSDSPGKPEVGAIGWVDLTVDDAEGVRDFYASVVGWRPEPLSMGDYSDFNMTAPGSGEPKAGLCHARGANAELPRQWLVYWVVADLDASMASCREHGGAVVFGPREMPGQGRCCVIRDPAGAVAALWQHASELRPRSGRSARNHVALAGSGLLE